MACQHRSGAWVPEMGYWVCAQCFSRLPDRPKTLGPAPYTAGGSSSPPQVIIWQAETARAHSGLTLAEFLRTMAKRYQLKGRGVTLAVAYTSAIEFLSAIGDAFGDPAYDWTHEGAREMANEDMQEWERADGAND
jgi:hypothetical protein